MLRISLLLPCLALCATFYDSGTASPMGYDIHITRASHWSESPDQPITLDEWIAYVKSDKEMRLDNRAEATTTSGERLALESPGIAVWTAWGKNGIDGNFAWFYYSDGEITVKNPDRAILRKMFTIATALRARIQGDDGEIYDANGNAHEP